MIAVNEPRPRPAGASVSGAGNPGSGRGFGLDLGTFVAVGTVATAVQYLVLVVGVELAAWPATIASCLGYGLSSTLNYWLNYHVTFRSRASHRIAAARFALVAMTGLGLNAGAMLLFEGVAGLHYMAAQLLATGLTLLWNYTASRFWTFRHS